MRTRLVPWPPVTSHQGGWDEIILIAAPLSLFVILRWFGVRKERREQAAQNVTDGPAKDAKP